MQQAKSNFASGLRQFLQACSEPQLAPNEIYGAHDLGCKPGDDYFYQGYRYVQDLARDVLVRADMVVQPRQEQGVHQ